MTTGNDPTSIMNQNLLVLLNYASSEPELLAAICSLLRILPNFALEPNIKRLAVERIKQLANSSNMKTVTGVICMMTLIPGWVEAHNASDPVFYCTLCRLLEIESTVELKRMVSQLISDSIATSYLARRAIADQASLISKLTLMAAEDKTDMKCKMTATGCLHTLISFIDFDVVVKLLENCKIVSLFKKITEENMTQGPNSAIAYLLLRFRKICKATSRLLFDRLVAQVAAEKLLPLFCPIPYVGIPAFKAIILSMCINFNRHEHDDLEITPELQRLGANN